MALEVVKEKEGCTFQVHVVPRSKRDEIVGLHGDALKVRLTAPPVEGKANQALRVFLAEELGIAPSAVEILSGHTSRQKRVRVTGVSAEALHTLVGK